MMGRQSLARSAITAGTITILLAGCNGRGGEGMAAGSPAAERDRIDISLERTACFGRCPIYTVAIDETGLVRYEGRAFVEHTGDDTARIAPERVRAIVAAADSLGFFELADSYRMGEPTCAEYFPDAPSVIAGVSVNGRAKRVVVDFGCTTFPRAVPELARRIDEVAGTARWTGADR